jgi:hypothetical protein
MGVTWANSPNPPAYKGQLRRRNDVVESAGFDRRSAKLTPNRSMTTTFPKPCHIPIDFVLALDGMASQSIKPNTAEAGRTSSIICWPSMYIFGSASGTRLESRRPMQAGREDRIETSSQPPEGG